MIEKLFKSFGFVLCVMTVVSISVSIGRTVKPQHRHRKDYPDDYDDRTTTEQPSLPATDNADEESASTTQPSDLASELLTSPSSYHPSIIAHHYYDPSPAQPSKAITPKISTYNAGWPSTVASPKAYNGGDWSPATSYRPVTTAAAARAFQSSTAASRRPVSVRVSRPTTATRSYHAHRAPVAGYQENRPTTAPVNPVTVFETTTDAAVTEYQTNAAVVAVAQTPAGANKSDEEDEQTEDWNDDDDDDDRDVEFRGTVASWLSEPTTEFFVEHKRRGYTRPLKHLYVRRKGKRRYSLREEIPVKEDQAAVTDSPSVQSAADPPTVVPQQQESHGEHEQPLDEQRSSSSTISSSTTTTTERVVNIPASPGKAATKVLHRPFHYTYRQRDLKQSASGNHEEQHGGGHGEGAHDDSDHEHQQQSDGGDGEHSQQHKGKKDDGDDGASKKLKHKEGSKHNSAHHNSEGKKSKKGYKKKHEYDTGKKGHEEKEERKKSSHEEKGKKKKHKDEGGHYGEEHAAAKGEKSAKYGEVGKHKKGYSTKGSHNVHKKNEFLKKHEFYDEHHEGDNHKKHGGFLEKHGTKKGGEKKKGHLDSGYDVSHKGKKGKKVKGKKESTKKGHKKEKGDEKHYEHEEKYAEKSSKSKKKKWKKE